MFELVILRRIALAKKTYVLDTNVLLDDVKIFDKFEGKDIILPFVVLEELDKHKTAKGELGANARNIIRQLDELSATGDLIKGVSTSKKTKISVCLWSTKCQALLTKNKMIDMPDNRILVTSLVMIAAKKTVTLLTNDISLRLKAQSHGVDTAAHDVKNALDSVDDIYSGLIDFYVPGKVIDQLHANSSIEVPKGISLQPNEYVHFIDEANDRHTGLGRYDGFKVVKITPVKSVSGIKPRNVRQAVAIDALLNNNITLVSILGKAGGGKTIAALAAAIEQVFDSKKFDKIILIKPISFVGEDIGYLPGSQMEKILPHFGNYIDNLMQLFPSYRDKTPESLLEYLTHSGKLELCPPTYMRGRSLPRSFIIVDEVQNLSRHEIKTIATRLGEDSKLVVMGDINQIDNHKLDALDNGLTHIIEAFRDETCAAHITFLKGERSAFSAIAAEKL